MDLLGRLKDGTHPSGDLTNHIGLPPPLPAKERRIVGVCQRYHVVSAAIGDHNNVQLIPMRGIERRIETAFHRVGCVVCWEDDNGRGSFR